VKFAAQVAAGFEDAASRTAAAVFVFGVQVIGATGSLVVEVVKAAIPGGG
jgi:hypothetical protein